MNPIVPQPSTVLVNGHALGKAFFYDNIGPVQLSSVLPGIV